MNPDYEIGFTIPKKEEAREKAQHTWPPQGIIRDISELLMRQQQNKLCWIHEDDFVCHAAKTWTALWQQETTAVVQLLVHTPNQSTLQPREQTVV